MESTQKSTKKTFKLSPGAVKEQRSCAFGYGAVNAPARDSRSHFHPAHACTSPALPRISLAQYAHIISTARLVQVRPIEAEGGAPRGSRSPPSPRECRACALAAPCLPLLAITVTGDPALFFCATKRSVHAHAGYLARARFSSEQCQATAPHLACSVPVQHRPTR